jgi:endopeptidase Clp ATP-binding regulatory subunit ClpX
MSDSAVDPREIERELKEFLGKKFGSQIHLAGAIPFGVPEPEGGGEPEGEPAAETLPAADFDLKPEQLEAYLDRFVVKQAPAKEVLATKICTHYNRVKRSRARAETSRFAGVGQIKSNILMVGPTGVGKTYIIKLIAKKIGIPFVKGDATKFSETGYVGGDVEDLVRDLVREANGDVRLAESGIIYIDEIDKIASSGSSFGPDVSRTGVQRGLLKPMEDTDVDLKVAHDMVSQMEALEDYRRTGKRTKKTINTRNILFILSGAFTGLEEIVKRRLSRTEIGFRSGAAAPAEPPSAWYLRHVTAEDFISYGFESEFIGRIPVTVVFDPLEEEDLYEILRNPNCPVTAGKKADFKAYDIDLFFEDPALRKLATLAHRQRTGARGLASVVEATLLKFEKRLPSTAIRRLVVTPEMVDDPAGELERLLADPEDAARAARFAELLAEDRAALAAEIAARADELRERHGFSFDERLTELAVRRMTEQGTDLEEACRHLGGCIGGLDRYRAAFREKTGLAVDFTAEARDRLIELAAGGDLEALCNRLFASYPPGLELLHEKTGQDSFTLGAGAVESPDQYLNQLIRETWAS